jgi:hypothetical protein
MLTMVTASECGRLSIVSRDLHLGGEPPVGGWGNLRGQLAVHRVIARHRSAATHLDRVLAFALGAVMIAIAALGRSQPALLLRAQLPVLGREVPVAELDRRAHRAARALAPRRLEHAEAHAGIAAPVLSFRVLSLARSSCALTVVPAAGAHNEPARKSMCLRGYG